MIGNKLRSRCGETLVEVLCALAIVALCTVVFATMISAASDMNAETVNGNGEMFAALSSAETGADAIGTGAVKYSVDGGAEETVSVTYYGADGMAVSYDVGIGSSARVYRKSVSISERQDLSITLSKAIMGELRYASDIEETGGKVTYTSAVYGEGAYISADGNGHITVGDTLLVGNGAYSNDSFSAAADVAFENGAFNVTLTVTERGADSRTVNFTVVPINK